VKERSHSLNFKAVRLESDKTEPGVK